MDTIAAYLIFLNLVGFLIMGEDKRRAKMHRWRISERMLFLVSVSTEIRYEVTYILL